MAFIVEDGSGNPAANSFITTDFFDSYHTDRGNDDAVAWSSSKKQINIIKATDYLNTVFRTRFVGEKKTNLQRLSWPRKNAYYQGESQGTCSLYEISENEIPLCLQEAVADLAKDADSINLMENIKPGSSKIKKKKIGPLEIHYEPSINSNTIWKRASSMITKILTGSGGSVVKMVRA